MVQANLTPQQRAQIASRFEVWGSIIEAQRWFRSTFGIHKKVSPNTIKTCHSKLLNIGTFISIKWYQKDIKNAFIKAWPVSWLGLGLRLHSKRFCFEWAHLYPSMVVLELMGRNHLGQGSNWWQSQFFFRFFSFFRIVVSISLILAS